MHRETKTLGNTQTHKKKKNLEYCTSNRDKNSSWSCLLGFSTQPTSDTFCYDSNTCRGPVSSPVRFSSRGPSVQFVYAWAPPESWGSMDNILSPTTFPIIVPRRPHPRDARRLVSREPLPGVPSWITSILWCGEVVFVPASSAANEPFGVLSIYGT